MNRALIQFGLVLLLIQVSCTGTRHLSEDEYLIRNGNIEFVSGDTIKEKKKLKGELKKEVKLKQNNKILWMRPRLSLYYSVKEPTKDKGVKYWLKYKVGTPPYIFSSKQATLSKVSLEDYLFNNSYFKRNVEIQIDAAKNEKTINFLIQTGPSYTIDTFYYKNSGTDIDSEILRRMNGEKEVKIGETYHLDNLKKERQRLAHSLMGEGYYYFRPDYFEFKADTSDQTQTVGLDLRLKSNTPSNATTPYKINSVRIEDDIEPGKGIATDSVFLRNVKYETSSLYIKPEIVVNSVHLESNIKYNREDHLRTLNHIRSLQVYKYVGIAYTPADTLGDLLDAVITLYPLPKMSISGELDANVKSNNFAGPGALLAFTNRNTFKRAELLNLSFSGRFETQYSGVNKGNTSYEVRTDGTISIPRLFPLKSRQIKREYLPTTTINLGAAIQERILWYQMLNFNGSINYNWRKNEKLGYQLGIIDVNISELLNTTDTFNLYLESNPSVRRSFEEQFIFGTNFSIYYSSSPNRFDTPFFLGLTLDPSGLLLSGMNTIVNGHLPQSDNPYKVLGLPYSQYVRGSIDIRKTFFLWMNNSFATRLMVGFGVPFGNSSVMPYIKQFYVGGTNSLRGFQARSIGPGSYHTESDSIGFFDQAGDLKIEMNLEYRFPLWGILHSALFIDMGNIWLVNEDDNRPGAAFNMDTFLSEMAVSSGIGLRIVINPVVVRFDWAWPMRYSYQTEKGKNWIIDEINFTSGDWLRNNLILNISLGYPF